MRLFGNRNTEGFSLVEMMVAVGIAGIGAAMIVPNYNKMVARGRQQEVKLQLSQIYTSERNFVLEHQSYTACLKKIGLKDPVGQMYYAVGFNTATLGAGTCGPNQNASCLYTSWDPSGAGLTPCAATDQYVVATSKAGQAPVADQTAIVSSWVDRDGFTAGAAGSVSTGTSPYDRWMIDQNKNLTQTANGV